MKIDLTGKNVIVTGGSTGIGKATVEKFALAGANVSFCARSAKNGEEVQKEISEKLKSGEYTNQIVFMEADVSDENSLINFIKSASQTMGKIDYAVNNAGIRGLPAPVHLIESESWDSMMNINLKGVFLSLKHELAHIVEQQGIETQSADQNDGKSRDIGIVNVSSIYGLGGSENGLSAYHAAKHGVIGLTKAAALEYAKYGIRINAVCPGWVGIEAAGEMDEGLIQHASASHPLNRMATMDEIANTIVFLCSDKASFTTGAAYVIDGGISAKADGRL